MRPNDFIMNSDYLTIANVENNTYEVTIPGGQILPSGLYTATFNLSRSNISQTFTRVYIHHSKWDNPSLWGIGSTGDTIFEDNGRSFYERIFVTTPADNTLRLKVEVQGDANAMVPSHKITIKAFRFKVPNVF